HHQRSTTSWFISQQTTLTFYAIIPVSSFSPAGASLLPRAHSFCRVLEIVGLRRRQPLRKQMRLRVLIGDDRVLDRPFHTNRRIIPANSRLPFIVVNAGAFVLDFTVVGKGRESTSESCRRINLSPVLR